MSARPSLLTCLSDHSSWCLSGYSRQMASRPSVVICLSSHILSWVLPCVRFWSCVSPTISEYFTFPSLMCFKRSTLAIFHSSNILSLVYPAISPCVYSAIYILGLCPSVIFLISTPLPMLLSLIIYLCAGLTILLTFCHLSIRLLLVLFVHLDEHHPLSMLLSFVIILSGILSFSGLFPSYVCNVISRWMLVWPTLVIWLWAHLSPFVCVVLIPRMFVRSSLVTFVRPSLVSCLWSLLST